jgi:hypothetical protein
MSNQTNDTDKFQRMLQTNKSDRDLLLVIIAKQTEMASDVKHLIEVRLDHEVRLRQMEQNAWKAAGVMTVVSVFVSAALAWAVAFFSKGK